MNAYLARTRIGIGRVGFGDALGDLAAFDSTIQAADIYFNAGEYGNAVTAYQAAGNTGAITIGPEIDVLTGNASQSQTHQAWLYNQGLASFDASTATVIEAGQAKNLAHNISDLYHSAATLSPPVPVLPPPPVSNMALADAARALFDTLTANGSTTIPFQQAADFQAAYNADNNAQTLVVDGKYGAATEAALQSVLNTLENPPQAAPKNAFTHPSGGGGTTTTTTTTTPVLASLPAKPLNWGTIAIVAAAVAGVGAIGYVAYKKKHKGRR